MNYIVKGIIAGIVAGIVLFVINNVIIYSGIFASFYKGATIFKKSNNLQLIMLDMTIGIILGIGFSIIYYGIPKSGLGKGLIYGLLVFLISTIPNALFNYIFVNAPSSLWIGNALGSLITLLASCIIISVIYELL